ncbi:threonine/serine exporter family protein [Paraflavisolibacter sp. H34]|uniref:threonine/serine exporter family protein n=1 Tax=Huijunlia imazamoxiresistens TaxID=3127457 RepID=UPI0030170F4F
MDYFFLEKGIWFGGAAVGFAVLFNVPVRALAPVFLIGAAAGLTKAWSMHLGASVVSATLLGAILAGLLSIPSAHNRHAPPLVFAIPAVIPMVPGTFAYRMMLGLIKLSGNLQGEEFTRVLSDTVSYGLKVMFILMSLAGGVAIPMLLTRQESAKHIRFRKVRQPAKTED